MTPQHQPDRDRHNRAMAAFTLASPSERTELANLQQETAAGIRAESDARFEAQEAEDIRRETRGLDISMGTFAVAIIVIALIGALIWLFSAPYAD